VSRLVRISRFIVLRFGGCEIIISQKASTVFGDALPHSSRGRVLQHESGPVPHVGRLLATRPSHPPSTSSTSPSVCDMSSAIPLPAHHRDLLLSVGRVQVDEIT
jgi:hypothetical protein